MKKILPQGYLDLLVRTAFLPEHEAALCWQQWKQQRDIDSITWEEHKIFARLATRLSTLAPDCPYRPRLEGLVKSHWTRSQLMLHASARALDVLIANGIPVMLLKGGALQTEAFSSQGPRITSDLDVLVPRKDFPRAIELLYAAGWRSNRSVEFLKIQWRFHPGMNLRCAPHGDIDIHHQPVHGRRVPQKILDALWQRARPQLFYGREVLVPAAEDLLVFTAAHAAHLDQVVQTSAAWVFDLVTLLRLPSLSSEKMIESSRAFLATPALVVTLSYLQDFMGEESTQKLLTVLKKNNRSVVEHWHFFLETRGPRYLRRFGGSEYEKNVVPRLKQHTFPARVKREVALADGHAMTATRQEIMLSPAPVRARALVLELVFDPPEVDRYKFEISADGMPLTLFTTSASRIGTLKDFKASVRIPIEKKLWQTLAVESYNKILLPAHPTPAEKRAATPVSFRVARLAWV